LRQLLTLPKPTLNHRQQRFADEYLLSGNATAAYKAARYSGQGHVAESAAQRLLSNVEVAHYVKTRQAVVAAKFAVTQERVMLEVSRLAFFDARKLFDADGNPRSISDLDEDAAAAVAGLEVTELYAGQGENRTVIGRISKWKLADKNSALEKLMRKLGMFKDSLEVTGDGDLLKAMLMGRARANKL
jgi:phage terminase small subunit